MHKENDVVDASTKSLPDSVTRWLAGDPSEWLEGYEGYLDDFPSLCDGIETLYDSHDELVDFLHDAYLNYAAKSRAGKGVDVVPVPPQTAADRLSMIDEAAIRTAFNLIFHDPAKIKGRLVVRPCEEASAPGLANTGREHQRWTNESGADALSEIIATTIRLARSYGGNASSNRPWFPCLIAASFGELRGKNGTRTAAESNALQVWADPIDHDKIPGSSVQKLRDIGIIPTFAVRSGGIGSDGAPRQHDWIVWETPLETAEQKSNAKRALKRLIDFCGSGDSSAVSLVHPYRPAGTLNRKSGQAVPVRIMEVSGRRWTPDALHTLLDGVTPETSREVKPVRKSPSEKVGFRRGLLENIKAGESLHDSTGRYAMSALYAGQAVADVIAELEDAYEECRDHIDSARWESRVQDIERRVEEAASKLENDDGFLDQEARRERVAVLRDPLRRRELLNEVNQRVAGLVPAHQYEEAFNDLCRDIGCVGTDDFDIGSFAQRVAEKLAFANDAKRVKALNARLKQAKKAADKLLKSSSAAPERAHETGGRPIIDLSETDDSDAAIRAWEAVTARASEAEVPRVFNGPWGLSRLVTKEGRRSIEKLNLDTLTFEVNQVSFWRGPSGRSERFIRVPQGIVREMLSNPNPPVLSLLEVKDDPYFSKSGRLRQDAGFYADDSVYLTGQTKCPPVSDKPTADEVSRAKSLLLNGALEGFPFRDHGDLDTHPNDIPSLDPWDRRQLYGVSSRANALAMILQPFVRTHFTHTPLYAVDKAQARTGGGKLTNVIHCISHGELPAITSDASSDEEMRKKITATLGTRVTVFMLDNVHDKISSKALCAALTASTWSDRKLGVSENVSGPIKWTWLAIGNSLRFSDEIAERICYIRVDARVPNPNERTDFKIKGELEQHVLDNRTEYLWAALTLIQNWVVVHNMVCDKSVTFGGFQGWVETMGGILHAAGVVGFMENRVAMTKSLAVADVDERNAFLSTWAETFGEMYVRAGDPNMSPMGSEEVKAAAGLLSLLSNGVIGLDKIDTNSKNIQSMRSTLGKKLGSWTGVYSIDAELVRPGISAAKNYRIDVRVESRDNAKRKSKDWRLVFDKVVELSPKNET